MLRKVAEAPEQPARPEAASSEAASSAVTILPVKKGYSFSSNFTLNSKIYQLWFMYLDV